MSIVSEFAARLKAQSPETFRLIGFAGDFAQLKNLKPLATPAIYFLVKDESSAENERMMGVLQRTGLDIAAVIITDNVSDAHGGAAALDIEDLKTVIRAVFVGWQPPSACEGVENIGGSLVNAAGGLVAWEHIFGAVFYLEDLT